MLERILREKIAVAALYSDAGWYVCTGFEKGDSRRRSVFSTEPASVAVTQDASDYHPNDELSEPHLDLSGFISEINYRVKRRASLAFPNWCERLFLEDKPELVILNTHSGVGYSGPSYLDIVNTDPTRIVTLSNEDVAKLAETTGRNKRDFATGNHGGKEIFLCGGVRVAPSRVNVFARPYEGAELSR